MKKLFVILLVAAMVLSLAACGGNSANNNTVTVTDMFNREVKLSDKVEKVIALSAGDCEIIYSLGAGEMMVGRGEYCDYPSEILEKPSLGSGTNANSEEIIALDPDVVFLSVLDYSESLVETLEKAGISVVMTDADTIEGVYTAIELIGKVVGKNDEATKLITSMKDAFAAITNSKADEKKTIYFEVSPLEFGLWSAGKNTFMDEIAEMIGAENVFADCDGWAQVSEEQVIERNPDYILTITMYYGSGQTPDEEILSRSGWQNIKAVTEKNVYMLNSDKISRPGPRLVEAAQDIYNLLYSK